MAKLTEVSAEEVRPEFQEVGNRLDREDKAANAKTTSRFLNDSNGPVELNAGERGVKKLGTKTYHAHEAVRGGLPGDIMQTATTKSGMPINDQSQLTNDSMVTIQGAQCTLETALRMGLVVRNADGSYSDSAHNSVSAAPQSQGDKSKVGNDRQARQEDAAGKAAADFLSPATRTFVDAVRQQLGHDAADTVITRAMAGNMGGGNPQSAINELASALGVEPDMATNFLRQLGTAATDGAVEYIEQRYPDVNGEEVFNWAAERMRPSSKASIMTAILHGATSEIDRMVEKFLINERY